MPLRLYKRPSPEPGPSQTSASCSGSTRKTSSTPVNMINNCIKVLLVLAALAFICHAQRNQGGQQCLCGSFKNTVDAKKNISDIQIFPATDFCSQVEIIITNKNGARYCLNPNLPVAKRFLNRIVRARK